MPWDETKIDGVSQLTADEWNDHVTDQKSRAKVLSGSGAPVSTPSMVGAIYVDTNNEEFYIAKGTSGSTDWIKLTGYSNFESHTTDNTIHFTQAEINVPGTQISYDNTSSGLIATDVQSAIDEIDNNISSHISNTNNPHNTTISDLSDVNLYSPVSGEVLVYDGTNWVNQALGVGSSSYTILKIYTPTSLTAHSEENVLATATESFTINKDLSEYTSLLLIFSSEYLISSASYRYNAYGRFTLGFQEIGGSGYAYDLTNTQTFWMYANDAYNKLRYNYIYTHIHQLTSAEKSNGIDIEVTIDAYGGGGASPSAHDFTHTCRHIIVIGIK